MFVQLKSAVSEMNTNWDFFFSVGKGTVQ